MKRIMDELSAAAGGSLIRRIEKPELSRAGTVLFVGLGRIGSETVSEIKKICQTELEPSARIAFLAVDSKPDVLHQLGLDEDERFDLFEGCPSDLLENPPEEIKEWLGDVGQIAIDGEGTQWTRQVGRAMLCGTSKYKELRSVISRKIAELKRVDYHPKHITHVVLIASLAGGTGSGIFIDVAYMINELLSDYQTQDVEAKLWGCFYTPEVLRNHPNLVGRSGWWAELCENTYVAMKELDYYMTNGSFAANAPTVYTMHAPDELTVTSNKPVFVKDHVWIVSPEQAGTFEETELATARNLLAFHYEVPGNYRGVKDSIMRSFSSVSALTGNWENYTVGRDHDGNNVDNAVDGCKFPAFLNYKYASLGCGTVYFPKDEMMAYCANQAFSQTARMWQVKPEKVTEFLEEHQINTAEQVLATIVDIAEKRFGCNADVLRLDRDREIWPNLQIAYPDPETAVKKAKNAARDKANSLLPLREHIYWCERMARSIANGVIKDLNSASFLGSRGPYFGTAVLAGYGEVQGCIAKFDAMLENIKQTGVVSDRRREEAEDVMIDAGRDLISNFDIDNDDDAQVYPFVNACYAFSRAILENELCWNYLKHVLTGVRDILKQYYDETYAKFVPVVDALKNRLAADAEIFVSAERDRFAGGLPFAADAYGILESETTRARFCEILDSGVMFMGGRTLGDVFAKSMLGEKSKDMWANFNTCPSALADEIRTVFSTVFEPFANGLLEKFLIVAYNDREDLNDERLDAIWKAEPETPDAAIRDAAIQTAADRIAEIFRKESTSLFGYDGDVEDLSCVCRLILLAETPHLNEALAARLTHGLLEEEPLGDACKSMIGMVKCVYNVALPLIKGVREYAQKYYLWGNDTLYLDAKTPNWTEQMPELYGADMQRYDAECRNDPSLAIEHLRAADPDTQMYEKLKEAYEYAVQNKYLYPVKVGYATVWKLFVVENPEFCFELLQHLKDLRNGTMQMHEILKKCDPMDYREYEIATDMNRALMARINESSADGTKNICRVIRSRRYLLDALLKAKKIYEESQIFTINTLD